MRFICRSDWSRAPHAWRVPCRPAATRPAPIDNVCARYQSPRAIPCLTEQFVKLRACDVEPGRFEDTSKPDVRGVLVAANQALVDFAGAEAAEPTTVDAIDLILQAVERASSRGGL